MEKRSSKSAPRRTARERAPESGASAGEDLDRARTEDVLRARDTEFRALIENLHSGVALIDSGGRFTLYNRRFLELFGLSEGSDIENVNSQDWAAWQVSDEAGRQLDVDEHPVRKAALTRRPVRNQLVAVRLPTGGELVWMLVSAEPLLRDDGSFERIICTYHEVTATKRAEAALARANERLSDVLASIEDDFYVLDRDWRFTFTSRRFTSRVGKEPADFVGQCIWTMFPAHRGTVYEENLRAAMERKETRRFELAGKYTDAWYRMTVFPSKEGVTVLGTEITEARQMEEALRAANARLVEADRRKDDFLAMLGHELRNPLAPIRNAAYILEHADPAGEQAERARGVLRRQSEHLTRLVDDLLDVTRITRGKIGLQRERTSLREVVLRAAEDVRPAMLEKGIAFRVDLPSTALWAHADPTRLHQVVANLLHNAFKFTQRGDEVAVSLHPDDGAAELRVRDTGAGIDPAVLPHVFEPFVQADRTIARSEGGLGLGLSLVKGIVELHGGEVRAESAGVGKGTEFVVRLPLGEPVRSEASRPGAAPQKGRRRVLIVDDNTDAAESLADILRMDGHAVEIAHDGPTALERLRAHRPDVVLCDIGLPGMSGYEVARAMRAEGDRGLKLIALSGYTQAGDVQRALEAGFEAHLAKPLDPDEIARLLA